MARSRRYNPRSGRVETASAVPNAVLSQGWCAGKALWPVKKPAISFSRPGRRIDQAGERIHGKFECYDVEGP